MLSDRLIMCLIAAWSVCIVSGQIAIWNYETAPAEYAPANTDWPADTELRQSEDSLTLVMALRPHCPCSRASLRELQRILDRQAEPVDIHILMFRPEDVSSNRPRTSLCDTARSLPNADITIDHDSREASRFGTLTSGHVILFAPDGRWLFSGGLTSSRAHEGAGRGRMALEQCLQGNSPQNKTVPVFGCEIIPQGHIDS